MTISAFGVIGLALVAAWVFGGIVLRLAGGLLALAGLSGLSLSGNANGLLVFILGACLWLAGQLHFRVRHSVFKSALAERLCLGVTSLLRYGLETKRGARSR